MNEKPPEHETQENKFKEVKFSVTMNVDRYTELQNQFGDADQDEIRIKYTELVHKIMRGENPEMTDEQDFLLMRYIFDATNYQKRNHATNGQNASQIIDPSNPNNGLSLTTDLDLTTELILEQNPWNSFKPHGSATKIVVIAIPRELINRTAEESRSLVPARIEYLVSHLPRAIIYGKSSPNFPIETIQAVLNGSPDHDRQRMNFNSVYLNPQYNPGKLIEIIRKDHPNYDPKSVNQPLGPTGMLGRR